MSTTSTNIWPGPECLNAPRRASDQGPRPSVYRLRIGKYGVTRNEFHGTPRPDEVIALAHVKARARHQRFVAWLRAGQWDGAALKAERCMSPEAFASAHTGHACVVVGRPWEGRWAWCINEISLLRDMLASPEWASLPWQVES